MIMTITYALKTFRLVIIIINVSYFLAMIWFIYADIVERAVLYSRDIDCMHSTSGLSIKIACTDE